VVEIAKAALQIYIGGSCIILRYLVCDVLFGTRLVDGRKILPEALQKKPTREQETDEANGRKRDGEVSTYVLELLFEEVNHIFLNDDTLLVQVFDDEVVIDAVDVDDDGFDGRIAFDQDA
jgi:hypothetical protein